MILSDVLKGVPHQILSGTVDLDVDHVTADSRRVKKNSLFLCVTGLVADGHDFIEEAIAAGATALIVEKTVNVSSQVDITMIKVESTRNIVHTVANQFFDYPAERLKLIGITGTNGKTSVMTMLIHTLEHNCCKLGVINTNEIRIGKTVVKKGKRIPTIPDTIELFELFYDMVQAGVDYVLIEVSSRSLALQRLKNCCFEVAVLTNITQDHLNFHKTMENYKKAKKSLFFMTRKSVLNGDDTVSSEIIREMGSENTIIYSVSQDSDLQAVNIRTIGKGTCFDLLHKGGSCKVELELRGHFNVYNALAAIGTLTTLGFDMEMILDSIGSLQQIYGRFHMIETPHNGTFIVDYAHTPVALENVLINAAEFQKNRLISVISHDGKRDRSVRPVMGEIAGKYSDLCIITLSHTFDESPQQIIDDLLLGVNNTNCESVIILDRENAINYAARHSVSGDVVVICGHARYTNQKMNEIDSKDDVEVIENMLMLHV